MYVQFGVLSHRMRISFGLLTSLFGTLLSALPRCILTQKSDCCFEIWRRILVKMMVTQLGGLAGAVPV
jgi:hypothetical protein